ncbi:hypothetical protein [Brevundimonas goettingensis]|uniref:Uncharacterized protein n=1 Tax=Brevundimonas goettingensis TaxID=2774190 RepID=A0A975C1T6_9CAUL|nr:hypothetical protein [Brevundimonas goettingensis]QTC92328.1 hypothetical protein IFJ75_05390 [Brevundimonas goettingensis]
MTKSDPQWTFESAVAFWREWSAQDLEPVWERFESAEKFLLKWQPATPGEAGAMLDVLLQTVASRSDGCDQTALAHLRRYVGDLPKV